MTNKRYYIRNSRDGLYAYGGSGFYPTFVPFENLNNYEEKGLFTKTEAAFYLRTMADFGFDPRHYAVQVIDPETGESVTEEIL